MISINEAKSWPIDPDYLCACKQCGEWFLAPKKAPACWECLGPEEQRHMLQRHKEVERGRAEAKAYWQARNRTGTEQESATPPAGSATDGAGDAGKSLK